MTEGRHNNFKLAASLICGDHLNLAADIKKLERGGADYIHFDVMDGVFVPRYGLYPEILVEIKKRTKIPVDVHLMTVEPEKYLEVFAKAGADIISIHAEATYHLHRTVTLLKNLRVKAGVVLNPATPLSVLDYLWKDIDLLMIMAINPGIVGHKLIPSIYEKIAQAREAADKYNPSLIIEIDGGVSWESGAKMVSLGANMLVCGTSTIYRQEQSLNKGLKKFRRMIYKSSEI